jgi:hypothetical protein
MTEGTVREGIGRRRLIQRGAAIAGGVWAVPVVQSLTNPVGATGSDPSTAEDCCLYYPRLRKTGAGTYECVEQDGMLYPPDEFWCEQLAPRDLDSTCPGPGCTRIVSAVRTGSQVTVRLLPTCEAERFDDVTLSDWNVALDMEPHEEPGYNGCFQVTPVENPDGSYTVSDPVLNGTTYEILVLEVAAFCNVCLDE